MARLVCRACGGRLRLHCASKGCSWWTCLNPECAVIYSADLKQARAPRDLPPKEPA